MSLFSTERIIQMLYMLVPIILALSFHEFAHAYVADKLGEDVYKRQILSPSKVEVPLPTSSSITREFFVAYLRILDTSLISTIKVL